MPSADSLCAIISPCGSLTQQALSLYVLYLCVLPLRLRLINGRNALPFDAGIFFFYRFSPYNPVAFSDKLSETQRVSRGKHMSFCTRAPGIRFRFTVVRGLYPVLRTHPTGTASNSISVRHPVHLQYPFIRATFFTVTVTCSPLVILLYPSPLPGWVCDLPNLSLK